MIPPEDQEREGGESAEAMGALETLLLSLGAGALVGLATYAPKAVNKAAAALRRAANKAVADSMAGVNAAVERDLVGALVLEAVTEADHLGEAKRRSKLVKAARAEGRRAARQTRRRMRKYAACMVDDLNAKFLREAARARSRMLGGAGAEGVNHRKAMAEAVARMAKDGLTAYTYERKDGAIVHVPVYVGVRRALQSAGTERQIEQTLAVAAAAGANMVEVSTTAGARKSHAEWQGKRYLIKGSSAKYPNFAKACKKGDPVDGIGGYNCRHQIAVCLEGDPPRFKDPLEGTGYSQERARAALTAQRGMENDLRKLKRQREVLKQNGLSTKEIDARIKAVDKGIDEFVAQHSKILKRDRHRESIYERARKAVGAEGKVWLDEGQRKAVNKAAETGRINRMEHNEPLVKLSKDGKNDFSVSPVVNTKAFHDAFDDAPLPKPVSEGAYREAGRILQATDGTPNEHLAAINARTGAHVADNLGRSAKRGTTSFVDDEVDAVEGCADGVVIIHNHPQSLAPSYRDFITAARTPEIKASVVVGHDGSVWLISIENEWIADILEETYEDYRDSYADMAEIKAIEWLLDYNKHAELFEYRRLR